MRSVLICPEGETGGIGTGYQMMLVEGGAHCEPAMSKLPDSSPILYRPHVLRGHGTVRLSGAGEVVFDLQGRGQVSVHRARGDSVFFSGRGMPRHVTATDTIISNAKGLNPRRLRLNGRSLAEDAA